MLFGAKSEKVLRQIGQLELQLEELQAARAIEESKADAPTERPAPAAWFAYSPDRRGENPRQHLKLYKGALQADAYTGFQQLYEDGTIVEVACWAHTRRKFHEIHIAHASRTTSEAIERIAALYAIEAEIRGSTPEIRRSGWPYGKPEGDLCSTA